MLISIETYITCEFPGGGGGGTTPSGSAHVALVSSLFGVAELFRQFW